MYDKKNIILKLFILLIISCFILVYFIKYKIIQNGNKDISVFSPRKYESIESPYRVMGIAKGNWFFEADFPIKLFDEEDNLLSVSLATALSDWMTEDFVPFMSEINFEKPKTENGYLLFQKDNPTGLPDFDDYFRLPIKFSNKINQKRTVNLFYYNQKEDGKISKEHIPCSPLSILPVQREVNDNKNIIEDTLNLLLLGHLKEEERDLGFTTEFPNKDFKMEKIDLKNGVLSLFFKEVPGFTTGGSCRVSLLSEQIRKTAMQFSEVKKVIFMPESIFQP